jgi:hypothetical protein
VFEQDGEVDEVADSGVLAFPEVAEHAVDQLAPTCPTVKL